MEGSRFSRTSAQRPMSSILDTLGTSVAPASGQEAEAVRCKCRRAEQQLTPGLRTLHQNLCFVAFQRQSHLNRQGRRQGLVCRIITLKRFSLFFVMNPPPPHGVRGLFFPGPRRQATGDRQTRFERKHREISQKNVPEKGALVQGSKAPELKEESCLGQDSKTELDA